ncbi:MAG TPA: APC family permease [Candidatus Limnocylindrales bacterium]
MAIRDAILEPGAPGAKGLRADALGFIPNIVIGVASTAPAYSLAVSLGLVAAAVGIFAPAIMWLAFLPMLCIAVAYYYMNRADPDCGTSFTWVSRAMGPHLGWMTGWAIIVADVIVMASLAEVAAQYTFSLVGRDVFSDPVFSVQVGDQAVDFGVIALGIVFVAVMTWICFVGIEVSARTQVLLLGIELAALAVFAVVALFRVYTESPAGTIMPSLDWLNPLSIVADDGSFDASALAAGLIIALFIYWGWDTTATVNEESANPTEQPGRATVVATVVLVATYVLVTIAAQAWAGAARLADAGESDIFAIMANEVLGSPLDKLLVLAVLTSAAASTQTTILPTARTALSMGAKGALPGMWAKMHPRFQTPTNATIWMGILSVAFYVALKVVSENVYYDALAALGLMIAFYYGLTGYACAIYYRHVLLRSIRNFVLIGLLPALGGIALTWAFVRSAIDMADPANSYSGADWFGVSVPLAITIASFVIGVALMVLWWLRNPTYFRQAPETFRETADGDAGALPTLRPAGSH